MTILEKLQEHFHSNTALRYFVIYGAPGWSQVSTLNYGYAPVSEEIGASPLARGQAFQIELYRQVYLEIGRELTAGECLVEVSCGRGGGLAWIAGRSGAHCIGLEKSWPARRYARARLKLDVRKSIAPALPLPAASVDAFISVEAFHNYASDAFVREVDRCLRPGGRIVVADRRRSPLKDAQAHLASLFERNGFHLLAFRSIMPNVLDALRHDSARKERLLWLAAKTPFYEELREMFACVGSKRFRVFETGEWSYFLLCAARDPSRKGAGG